MAESAERDYLRLVTGEPARSRLPEITADSIHDCARQLCEMFGNPGFLPGSASFSGIDALVADIASSVFMYKQSMRKREAQE